MDGIVGDLILMETVGDALRLAYRLRDDPDTSVRCLDVPPSAAVHLGTRAVTPAEAFVWWRAFAWGCGSRGAIGVGFAAKLNATGTVARITFRSDPVPDPNGDG